jgi:hypothetical protein
MDPMFEVPMFSFEELTLLRRALDSKIEVWENALRNNACGLGPRQWGLPEEIIRQINRLTTLRNKVAKLGR